MCYKCKFKCKNPNWLLKIEVQLVVLSPLDVIAREYWYHRNCYRNFATAHQTGNLIYRKTNLCGMCFCDIAKFVLNYLTEEGIIFKLSDLTVKYEEMQNKKNISIRGAPNRLLQARLINQSNDDICWRI